MAEEFQAGICGENWWNPPKSVFARGLLPCYMVNTSDMGTNYGTSWMTNDLLDPKPRSCKEANISADSAIGFQNSLKAQQADSAGAGGTILMDSTLQMMGFGLSSSSSSSSDWSQTLLPGGGRGADSYNSMLQEDMNQGLNSSQIPKDWSPKSFASTAEDSSINSTLTALKEQEISLDQPRIVPVISSGNSAHTCQGLYTGFSMESPQSYGYSSALIQSLFEPDPQPQQQPFFSDRSMNYLAPPNHAANLNELSPSWSKTTSLMKPSSTKQQPSTLQFSNNTAFWNSSATAISNIRATDITSSQSQYLVPSLEEKPNCGNLTAKSTSTDEDRDSGSGVKKGSEPSFKRPRIETPSPLPTFKVRKEKLGDRITALQQLVSPFGKTDTASVLHEAIDYIKFLHDQVSVLSAPYMKNGNPVQRQQGADRLKESEGKQDLKSRGLCLVPISSTFPVANETTVDFWTPTFGGTFR